jgi:hypothetical protein
MDVSIPVSRFPVSLQPAALAAAKLGGKLDRVDSKKEVEALEASASKLSPVGSKTLAAFLNAYQNQVVFKDTYFKARPVDDAKVEEFVRYENGNLIVGTQTFAIEDSAFGSALAKALREAISTQEISKVREGVIQSNYSFFNFSLSIPVAENKTTHVAPLKRMGTLNRMTLITKAQQFILDALDEYLVASN